MRSSSERLARLRFEGGPAEMDSEEGPDGLGRVGQARALLGQRTALGCGGRGFVSCGTTGGKSGRTIQACVYPSAWW
jgi:hypothetical protein